MIARSDRTSAVLPGGRRLACLATFAMTFAASATPASSLELITPQEAALPAGASPSFFPQTQGGPTRRPSIVTVSPPAGAGLVHSPLHLKIKFQAFGGVAINPESAVVTYAKTPAIDLTQRLMPFITADGIDVPDAEVPPGKHLLYVIVKDKDGRPGGANISFEVGK